MNSLLLNSTNSINPMNSINAMNATNAYRLKSILNNNYDKKRT